MLRTRCFSTFSSDPVKLYFSVPVELYTVFSTPKHLAKTLVKNLAKTSGQNLTQIWAKSSQNIAKIESKSGHADLVLKTALYFHLSVHLGRWIVYSATFSRSCGGGFYVVLEPFRGDWGGL